MLLQGETDLGGTVFINSKYNIAEPQPHIADGSMQTKSLANNLMHQTSYLATNHQGICEGFNLLCLQTFYLCVVKMPIILV
jgi:hypothetical protein